MLLHYVHTSSGVNSILNEQGGICRFIVTASALLLVRNLDESNRDKFFVSAYQEASRCFDKGDTHKFWFNEEADIQSALDRFSELTVGQRSSKHLRFDFILHFVMTPEEADCELGVLEEIRTQHEIRFGKTYATWRFWTWGIMIAVAALIAKSPFYKLYQAVVDRINGKA